MKKRIVSFSLSILVVGILISFTNTSEDKSYVLNYKNKLALFEQNELELIDLINKQNCINNIEIVKDKILQVRKCFKGLDFWFRYLEPTSQKKINGPLPVEWETEVFEKYEKPYKREGAGYTLALQYLEEEQIDKQVLLNLVNKSLIATQTYKADSITNLLKTYHSFYLCNRLFLLNLATIYTSGFDCPTKENILPELLNMMEDVNSIYTSYNSSFPNQNLPENYLSIYKNAINFVANEPKEFNQFNHFGFIKNYVNPLFGINQQLINLYKVQSKSVVDYSLTKNATSIFSKNIYTGQNTKGIYLRVTDEKALTEISNLGKLLFYDPILSANNERSCASCHKPTEFFTDTINKTSLQYNRTDFLERNTPTLLNSPYNHLIMADGKHINLQSQTSEVITNEKEMGSTEKEVLNKILSCDEYKNTLTYLLTLTPTQKEISFNHVISAITYYYSQFSNYNSPFDDAMNNQQNVSIEVQNGFNVFMGKGECGTCHFAPQFNGVKPPYVGSEFEVIGVPQTLAYASISNDKGRFLINPATETLNAFRTGTIRNAAKTKPYMHNGIFNTLDEVIDFYNNGGGAGKGLNIPNQTLSADSLQLTNLEKQNLIAFIQSLTENIPFEQAPKKLPKSTKKILNKRLVGGIY